MPRSVAIIIALVVLVAAITAALAWLDTPTVTSGTDGPMVCADDSVSAATSMFERVAEDAALQGLDRSPVMLHDLAGERFTVLVFCAYSCPCSDGYVDRLRALRGSYEPRGVGFAAIHSSADEDVDGMRRYIERKRYPLPVYRDELGAVADALGATVTPEVFLFDAQWRLRYHGRIDDDKGGTHVTHRSLANALDTLLAGASLRVREHSALGCAIVRAH